VIRITPMIRTQAQIHKDIAAFINENGIMNLATQSSTKPWVCTVYYGVDENLNLYIVTDPNSIHGRNVAHNSKVAFNIFDSHQKITKPKQGLQGWGTIQMVKGVVAIVKALKLWHKQNPGIEKAITLKEVKKIADTKVYIITPKYFKYFHQTLYTPEEYGIWER